MVKPAASILVPCYNEAETIGWLLQALAAQDLARGRLEVLVSDGRSSDASRQVVEDFGVGEIGGEAVE